MQQSLITPVSAVNGTSLPHLVQALRSTGSTLCNSSNIAVFSNVTKAILFESENMTDFNNDDDLDDHPRHRTLSPTARLVIILSFFIGVIGNMAALYILHKERKNRYKNKKHSLMLRCLAGNDLVGLLGMLIQMLADPTHGRPPTPRWSCVFRVVWRGFGVSSGCVALVMAWERWLALTHPFLYQKKVTYNAVLKAIVSGWITVFIISCMPFVGFGMYYDSNASQCKRYREAINPIDIVYAYIFFSFGLLLSIGIAVANLAVTSYLWHTSPGSEELTGRRISRAPSRGSQNQSRTRVQCLSSSTPDEIAFARLMVALSITFLICWLPNMIAIPLAQSRPTNLFTKRFFELADVLMAIHFTLDPYIYVLLHHYSSCLRVTCETVQSHCCNRNKSIDISQSSPCLRV